jgi:hypothetical protein
MINSTALPKTSPLYLINGPWHAMALTLFMTLVVTHAAEHILQVIQVFVLDWSRPDAGGVLGLWLPELARAELLHTGYNLFQVFGLAVLRHGFSGQARTWWTVAIIVQAWHFFEHVQIQTQYYVGWHLWGGPKPGSILEFLMPRIELHFIYNMVVFVPTIVAVALYAYPRLKARRQANG